MYGRPASPSAYCSGDINAQLIKSGRRFLRSQPRRQILAKHRWGLAVHRPICNTSPLQHAQTWRRAKRPRRLAAKPDPRRLHHKASGITPSTASDSERNWVLWVRPCQRRQAKRRSRPLRHDSRPHGRAVVARLTSLARSATEAPRSRIRRLPTWEGPNRAFS